MLVMDCIKDDMETPQPMVLVTRVLLPRRATPTSMTVACLSPNNAEVERPP
jgi:hypothetical protein